MGVRALLGGVAQQHGQHVRDGSRILNSFCAGPSSQTSSKQLGEHADPMCRVSALKISSAAAAVKYNMRHVFELVLAHVSAEIWESSLRDS